MSATWQPSRAKVQLKLATQRTRLLAAKKEALCKKSRRDIASLVERGKLETARIRVETVINEEVISHRSSPSELVQIDVQIHIELLELLELYCELLTARFGLVELQRDVEPTVAEAVYGLIHAALKTELRELHVLREMLISHYGKEVGLAATENRDGCVPERVLSKINVTTPQSELVDMYLYEISKAYGLSWKPDGMRDLERPEGEVPKPAGGLPSAHPPAADLPAMPLPPDIEPDDAPHTVTITTNLPSPSTTPARPPAPPIKKSTEDEEYDALAKRFEALKKR